MQGQQLLRLGPRSEASGSTSCTGLDARGRKPWKTVHPTSRLVSKRIRKPQPTVLEQYRRVAETDPHVGDGPPRGTRRERGCVIR